MKKKRILGIILILTLVVSTLLFAVSCKDKKEEQTFSIIDLKEVNNLAEIQKGGDLVFEWVNGVPYNPDMPTAVIFHGEYTNKSLDSRFSMELDSDIYTKYDSSSTSTPYVLKKNIAGHHNNGFIYDLSKYWQRVVGFNIAIFHWEKFADETDTDMTLSKLFAVPKMRYKTEDGYETNKVPNYSLVEIASAEFLDFIPDTAKGREIRFVGNGVGANLALGVSSYLHFANDKGVIDDKKLPTRTALCDPYINPENINLKSNFADFSTENGVIGMVDEMLEYTTNAGVVTEMIEMYEKSQDSDKVDTSKYAYDFDLNPSAEEVYESIKDKLAYLQIDQTYTLKIVEEKYQDFMAQKRVALDWYLYSIIGSDDTGVGNPKDPSSTASGSSNWGVDYLGKSTFTRPILNDRATSNNGVSSSSMSNNFGVSAWTPTVYTMALKGLRFSLKDYSGSALSDNVHSRPYYQETPYVLNYFSSEIYQKSNQKNYTLICGFVGFDKNKNNVIDDGINAGIADCAINVDIVLKSDKSEVANFDVVTDKNGYYAINLPDKVNLGGGEMSESGYTFKNAHTITLTVKPNFKNMAIPNAISSNMYTRLAQGHNFSSYEKSFDLQYYYANAITIQNCLMYEG